MSEDAKEREQKHILIIGAVERLGSKIVSLEDLLKTIGGIPSDEPNKAVEANPCLREFLDRTTDELDALSGRLTKIIDGLSESLF